MERFYVGAGTVLVILSFAMGVLYSSQTSMSHERICSEFDFSGTNRSKCTSYLRDGYSLSKTLQLMENYKG